MINKIPEAKAIRAWNLTRKSKGKKSKFVPEKPPSQPVNPSMFFNPFKFKRGRRREPKKDQQRTKRKEKGPKQTLGIYKQ